MAPILHNEADAIRARLTKEGITSLYHFTSVENLQRICQVQSLCSKKTLQERGIWPPPEVGGEGPSHNLDLRNDNWDKVPLSLTPYTPMAYRRKRSRHLCFLLVSPEVAPWSGVVFTDSNAARNEHRRGSGLTGLNYIKFDVIRSIPYGINGWHQFVQAEVLVPNTIPFAYVPEIVFVSKASAAYAEQLCSTLLHPRFSVHERLFTDSYQASEKTIGFPFVTELIVTDTNIDKNMLYFSHLHKNIYSKSDHKHVTMVASVRVFTGTKAKIVLSSTNELEPGRQVIDRVDFAVQTQRLHQKRILLDDLPIGVYLLKYYLNEVCWASTSFEVHE